MGVRAAVLSHGVNFEIRALHAISGLFVLILKILLKIDLRKSEPSLPVPSTL
jgi:hypothetical protein